MRDSAGAGEPPRSGEEEGDDEEVPRFGVSSICGRRREMEDAVAIHPSFIGAGGGGGIHYFAVFDGHGCSHVRTAATTCMERMHVIMREEFELETLAGKGSNSDDSLKCVIDRSFARVDGEVIDGNEASDESIHCRCERRRPKCESVGSTAVVALLLRDKIFVANCGDSRAVLCRDGRSVALSSDHKPDRSDEMNRIEAAGGRVIYWQGARVLGVLAMSRAIGDSYLKPFVSSIPEVTVTERTESDELLILASDGLWDVVSNDTACAVARMCLSGGAFPPAGTDETCGYASMMLTQLALARGSVDNASVVVVDLGRRSRQSHDDNVVVSEK
ncbi:hypothetical protein M569_16200 [Genlisea aurea]|uniref:protein-serine/threonine phosphatase n=1 Tax=Genlisea aurea TaxID=192259 RepID=S8BW70_9LAMI|nr:hypothetical protein M569_16200 [Genlisea aurea]